MGKLSVLLLPLVCFFCSSLPRKAYEGRWNEVRAEIEKGADPNAVLETSGDSILFFAAEQGNMEMVRFLLAKGAKPDLASPSGETPLYGAAGSCQTEIVKLLVERGADPRKRAGSHGSVMHIAAQHCAPLIAFFASRGLSVNTENSESNELTPLMAAAASGNADGTKELLRLGADIHRRNRDNQNAFDYVFHLKNSKILILLLDHGASPILNESAFVLSFWGVDSFENMQALLRRRLITPAEALHAVVAAAPFSRGSNATEGIEIQSREEIIRKLKQTGVSIHLRDREGRTVMMTALQSGASLEFLKFLVQEGASCAGEDKKEGSALSLAVNAWEESLFSTGLASAEEILAFISTEAAKQSAQLSKSEQILRALTQGNDAGLTVVLKSGYRFQNQSTGQIALVFAAAHRGPDMLLQLLEAGALVNRPPPERHSEGMLCCLRPTALIAAAARGKTANVRFLLGKGADREARFGCCGGGIGAMDAAQNEEIKRLLAR